MKPAQASRSMLSKTAPHSKCNRSGEAFGLRQPPAAFPLAREMPNDRQISPNLGRSSLELFFFSITSNRTQCNAV
jgi:hypothetical protein